MSERKAAKLELLIYLIGIAQATPGAEIWRAMFAEMKRSIEAKEKVSQIRDCQWSAPRE